MRRPKLARGVLYADARIGGVEEWIYGDPRDAAMRMPDKFLECVCYVCTKIHGEWKFGGTAFFIGVPSESVPDRTYIYAITARHCIKKIEELGGDVHLRVNLADGRSVFIQINTEWFYPESETSDLAVLPIAPMRPVFENMALPYRCLATPETIDRELIGIGDEIYIAGLFTLRHGRERNHPIVRSGIIASMVNEKLEDATSGKHYDAYLIEVRSIGGLSGSPVMVMVHQGRGTGEPFTIKRSYYLLGLIRGHWDLKKPGVSPLFGSDLEQVNMGMAIVTPAHEIAGVLQSEVLAKERRRLDRKAAKEGAPTLD
jgi:hypothetical protein